MNLIEQAIRSLQVEILETFYVFGPTCVLAWGHHRTLFNANNYTRFVHSNVSIRCVRDVHRSLFWLLPRDGNSHGSGKLERSRRPLQDHPSFRARWRVGDAVVGRGNTGWTKSKSGHPCPCQNCSQGPPVEKT